MTKLEELGVWSKLRRACVVKVFEATEVCPTHSLALVSPRGTRHGERPEDTPFSGIRFVDRFELDRGLITRQDVWNDIAEVRP